jgi:hypothetical protein
VADPARPSPRPPQTTSKAAPATATRSAAGRRRAPRQVTDRKSSQTEVRGRPDQTSGERAIGRQSGRSRDSRRRAGPQTETRPIALGDPAEQGFALSRFDRLGKLPEYAAPSPFLSSFGSDSGGEFVWALQLLAVMLLIGLGGFLRISRPH